MFFFFLCKSVLDKYECEWPGEGHTKHYKSDLSADFD